MLGNHEHDDRLEDLNRSAADRRQLELRRLLVQLEGLTGLSTAASVDREMLCTEASRELFSLEELNEPSWDALRHNPGTALYALIAQDFAPLSDRLTSIANRLRAVPDYFAAARHRLVDPPKVHLESRDRTAVRYPCTHHRGHRPVGQQAGRRAEFAEPIERAAGSVLEYQGWLRDLLPNAPTTFRLGEQRYAGKLALSLATSWRPADLVARAYADLARIEAELAELVSAGAGRPAGRVEIAAEFDRLATDVPTSADILDRCRAALAESAGSSSSTSY